MIKIRKFLLCPIIALVLCLNGCNIVNYFPIRNEIDQIEFIRVIGIDKSHNNPDHVRVVLLYLWQENNVGPSEQDQGGTEQEPNAHTVISEGRTVLEAINTAQTFSERQLFLGHMSVALIGEEAAKENLIKYMDFISRGLESRLSQRVYITKGSSAEDFIIDSIKSGHSLPTVMEHLRDDYRLTSISGDIKLIELMNWLDTKYTGVFVPAVKITEGKSTKSLEREKEMDVELDGYAIFDEAKLKHYADKSLATAINMANNQYVNGVIIIPDPFGAHMALEIVELTCKKKYKFDGDELKHVNLNFKVTANVGEQHSNKNVYDKECMKYLNKQLVEVLREDIYRAIEFTQDKKIDILGIGNGIKYRHPIRWEKMEDSWKEILPYIQIDVDMDSRIARTYDIREPGALESEQ